MNGMVTFFLFLGLLSSLLISIPIVCMRACEAYFFSSVFFGELDESISTKAEFLLHVSGWATKLNAELCTSWFRSSIISKGKFVPIQLRGFINLGSLNWLSEPIVSLKYCISKSQFSKLDGRSSSLLSATIGRLCSIISDSSVFKLLFSLWIDSVLKTSALITS